MTDAQFVDTSVRLYLLSADDRKAQRAEESLDKGGVVSVQVLNEFASVASRKFGMPIREIREALGVMRAVCRVVPVDEATHELGFDVAQRYGMSIFDAMVVSSALRSECAVLVTEDLQHGQVFERRLRVRNPFVQVGR